MRWSSKSVQKASVALSMTLYRGRTSSFSKMSRLQLPIVQSKTTLWFLKELLHNACDDYCKTYNPRGDLRHMPKLERRFNQDGGFQSNYLSEVRGTCTRAPLWLEKLFTYPVPHATKSSPEVEHVLSYDNLAMKQVFGFITMECYLPSHQGKTSKNGNKEGQDRDRRIKKKYAVIFNQKELDMASEFHLFNNPWCIFTRSEVVERNTNFEDAR
jgi:hypothetical protein